MLSSAASARFAAGLYVLIVALTFAALVLTALLVATPSYDPFESWHTMVTNSVLGLAFGSVGALIATRRPGNLVGWSQLVSGLGIAIYFLASEYAELAVLARPDEGLPGGLTIFALFGGSWTLIVSGIFLLLLRFPNGALPSRRWRYLGWAVPVCLAIVWPLTIVYPDLDAPFEDFENPLAITDNPDYLAFMFPLIITSLSCMLITGLHLIYRFWRSEGDEREQYKWLACAAGLFVATFWLQGSHPVVDFLGGVAFLALPAAVGIAVLRYRLYDIDVIINRTLVYVPLTAILAGLFVASTTLARTVFTDLTDAGSDASIAISTLAVVALLTPLKNKLQAIVDRHFKERLDPLAAVEQLTDQGRILANLLDPSSFIERLLKEIALGLGADGAVLERYGKRIYSYGRQETDGALTFPLIHNDLPVGALLLWLPLTLRGSDAQLPLQVSKATAVLAHILSISDPAWFNGCER